MNVVETCQRHGQKIQWTLVLCTFITAFFAYLSSCDNRSRLEYFKGKPTATELQHRK